LPFEIHIEPLLACLTGSFLIINYSKHRTEFHKLLHDIGPMIYAVFFTLAGAMISLDILIKVWTIALLLFAIRIFALIIGTYIGTTLAGNPKLFKRIGWAPYVTQAGIAFAIVTEVATEFSTWGNQFATIVIAVIVLNQIVGPPLFKWAIKKVGESRLHAKSLELDIIHKAIIFGFDDQSLALARELKKHNWIVKIACLKKRIEIYDVPDIEICFIDDLSIETFDKFKIKKSEAIVLMLSDEENYTICESVYENIGTKEIIVRLHNRDYFNRFHELGAIVIDPSTAMINLLDHFVRSPMATSLLLGMEDNKDTLSQEVLDKDLHGVSLRNLRLPSDVLILSVKRKGQMIISHGYTRLRLGDIVTIVGSPESLEIVRLRFEK
jgi:Trk K+ transport system NAD-binding subunit